MINLDNEIVLIGGLGYVGSSITRYFNSKKINVSILDNNIYEKKIVKDERNQYLDVDIREDKIISDIDFSSKNIILLAGLVGDPITNKYPDASNEINLLNMKKLIKKLNKCNKLVFISTCSNYGFSSTNEALNEDSSLNPISLYSKAKVEIENFLISSDINYTILRFATAFGHSDNMRFDLTLNEFTVYQYFNKYLEVYDYETFRPYCHVNDFANVIEKVLDAPNKYVKNQIFNVGSEENNISKKELIKIVSNLTQNNNYDLVSKTKDKRNYVVDFSKVERVLNFKTEYSIKEGIQEIINNLQINKYDLNEDFSKVSNYYGNYFISDQNLELKRIN